MNWLELLGVVFLVYLAIRLLVYTASSSKKAPTPAPLRAAVGAAGAAAAGAAAAVITEESKPGVDVHALLEGLAADDPDEILNKMQLALNSSDNGASLRNKSGFTPLHTLCRHASSTVAVTSACQIAQLLIQYGCAVNDRAPDGVTPLLLAVVNRNWPLVRCLCLLGADMNIPALHSAEALSPVPPPPSEAASSPKRSLPQSPTRRKQSQQPVSPVRAAPRPSPATPSKSEGILSVAEAGYSITASDMIPRRLRVDIFRCLSGPQTALSLTETDPGGGRDRCMECAGIFTTLPPSRKGKAKQTKDKSRPTVCSHCGRLVCQDCCRYDKPSERFMSGMPSLPPQHASSGASNLTTVVSLGGSGGAITEADKGAGKGEGKGAFQQAPLKVCCTCIRAILRNSPQQQQQQLASH